MALIIQVFRPTASTIDKNPLGLQELLLGFARFGLTAGLVGGRYGFLALGWRFQGIPLCAGGEASNLRTAGSMAFLRKPEFRQGNSGLILL